jgi:hypothetical protein
MKFFFIIFQIYHVIGYNIKFLGGSFVRKNFYLPLLNTITDDLKKNNISSNYEFMNYFDELNDEPNNILICHSFGSYFGLLKSMNDKNNNIKGCVIINGNFNQRNKMFYPSIKLRNIHKKVLVILSTNDKRLPIHKAIDDLYVKNEENLTNIFFYFNNETHFSSFENKYEINKVSQEIVNFIKSCKLDNLNQVFYHNSIFSFIKSKPNIQNQMYYNHDIVLFKTNNINIDEYLKEYLYYKIEWNKIYLNYTDSNINYTNFLNKKKEIIKILYIWFTKKPQVKIKDKKIICDLLVIPIKDNIIYYKFPTREYIFDSL